jgi:hypothetical protein
MPLKQRDYFADRAETPAAQRGDTPPHDGEPRRDMGRYRELLRAMAWRAKAAKITSDGVALGDAHLKEEGQRLQAAARQAEAEAKRPRHRRPDT